MGVALSSTIQIALESAFPQRPARTILDLANAYPRGLSARTSGSSIAGRGAVGSACAPKRRGPTLGRLRPTASPALDTASRPRDKLLEAGATRGKHGLRSRKSLSWRSLSHEAAERSAEMRLLQMLLASVALSSAAFLPGSLPRRSAVSSHTPRVAAVAMNGDYYSRLGVQRNADEKDIKNVSTQPARSSWHARAAFSLLPASSPARPLASRTLLTRRPLGCRRTESRRDSGTRMSTRRRRRRRNSRRLTRRTR